MPEFLSLPEVAELLRIGERTAYQLARRGGLPAIKVGGQWRFHRPTIIRWAETGGPAPQALEEATEVSREEAS